MIFTDEPEVAWLRRRSGEKWQTFGDDVLACWVADMDFPLAPAIRSALADFLETGDLGYPREPPTALREAFCRRMSGRYGWDADPAAVREVTDVVQGLQLVLELASAPGDAVAVHVPTYPPFLQSLAAMRRPLVALPLEDSGGGFAFDPERTEAEIADARARVLLLVNPHNPTGRVFTAAELGALAEIAERHDLLVVADEIHAELAYPGHVHLPFAGLFPSSARRTVTLTSATKAFNIAGARCAIQHIGDPDLLARRDAVPSHLYGRPGVLGVVATLAAWERGAPWQTQLQRRLAANRERLATRLRAELPAARFAPPEASYLAWIDFTGCGLGRDPAAALLADGRVALASGPAFGPGGEGHARLNFATGPNLLEEIVDRLVAVAS